MRPRRPEGDEPDDLFRARLGQQLDLKHPLVRLAGLIDWEGLESAFGPLYHERAGRPGKPTRLMVGLTYLKHTYNLSDEAVCERWVENPYWQFFCGFDYLQHQLPIDPSSLTRWRERIGTAGMERLLAATVEAALAAGAVKPTSLERVTVDTTVQPKAIAHPLDSRLYNRGREILVRLAARHGLELRQSYRRLAKRALRLASRYAHARQMRRARREINASRSSSAVSRATLRAGSRNAPTSRLVSSARWRWSSVFSRSRRPIAPSSTRCMRPRSNVSPRARRTSATSSA
jgi:IS5 family transposase